MRGISIIATCCDVEDMVELLPTHLFPVVARLRLRHAVELIVIDDGSVDETWVRLIRLARDEMPCQVVLRRLSRREGPGAAVRLGCGLATGHIIVALDIGGGHPFEIIETLVRELERGADAALAALPVRGSLPARTWNRSVSLCYRILVNRRISSYSAPCWAYWAPQLRSTLSVERGSHYAAKTHVEALRRGARIVEVACEPAEYRGGAGTDAWPRLAVEQVRHLALLAWLRMIGGFWMSPALESVDDVKLAGSG